MKKKKSDVGGSSIFSLWEKASKAKKTNETDTTNQTIVEASSSHNQPENNLKLALVSPPDEEHEPESRRAIPNPIVEDEETIDEEDEETQADLGALERDLGKRIPISSVDKDAAFCFVFYLFKDKTKCPGGDSFVKKGFRNWHMKSRLTRHEGGLSSSHAEAQEKYDMFTTPCASIRESLASNTSQYKALYKQRLTWTLKCLRFLLH
uniref:Uncharacterized protein n=1 Tax=Avena sativa TaxID=4498 RepID=A0ACD5WK14_AVESA